MRTRPWLIAAPLVLVLGLLAACAPEPSEPTPTPTRSSPTATESASASPTPSPSESASAGGLALPSACEQIYSPGMFAALTAGSAPLNDPGITMLSTQNAELLEVLDSVSATLRCTWGAPSEYGLSTNVSAVDGSQAASILTTLQAAGFACEPLGEGTLCTYERRGITQDDVQYALGESHYVGGGGWVATNWLNAEIAGYTQDIVATLWG